MTRELAARACAHVNGPSEGRAPEDRNAFSFADSDGAEPRGEIFFERELDYARRVADRNARELGRHSAKGASRAKRRNVERKESRLGHRNLLKVTFN